MDRNASDNEYLHKDFHGALCYAIKYIDDTFGREATSEYLQQVAKSYYRPLIDKLKKQGLTALERHWKDIFTKEGGQFTLTYDDSTLTLTVTQCPAVTHITKTGQLFTDRYCQTTVIINETICDEAGFACSCNYEPGKGRCVQKFWKKDN